MTELLPCAKCGTKPELNVDGSGYVCMRCEVMALYEFQARRGERMVEEWNSQQQGEEA